MVDPGIGFGKTAEQNLEVLARLAELRVLGLPILLGTSRKSTIGRVLGTDVDDRLEGTAATVARGTGRGGHGAGARRAPDGPGGHDVRRHRPAGGPVTRVYLGLGSNIGDRAAHLAMARRRLEEAGIRVVAASAEENTSPVGGVAQDDFLNQVLEVETVLAPEALLRLAKQLEGEAGAGPAACAGDRASWTSTSCCTTAPSSRATT